MRHLIVGAGSIGRRHFNLLQQAGQIVIGFVDPDVDSDLAVTVYKNIEDGLHPVPDMVWICSPTSLHAEQAIMVIRRGINCFIEKPLAASLKDATEIAKVCKLNDSKVWVGCNMRFHPAVMALKALVKRGEIGRPLLFRAHFSHYLPNMRPGVDYRSVYAARKQLGGGVILDDIHDLDLALFFNGPEKEIKSLSSQTGQLQMDAEDAAIFLLRHSSGVLSEIHMDFLRQDKSRGIEIIGSEGSVEWRNRGKNPDKGRILLYSGGKTEQVWSSSDGDVDAMFSNQLAEVMAMAAGKNQLAGNLMEAIAALEIAEHGRVGQ